MAKHNTMINLLPVKEKEEFILRQNKKLTIVLGTAFLIASVCLILVLLSIKFYVLGEVVSQKFILDQTEKKYQTADFLVYKGLLDGYSKSLIQIKSFYKDKIQLNAALRDILDVNMPEGVYFINLSMARSEDSKVIAKISGISDTRDNLLLFRKNLENSEKIKSPNFSPESWINSKNINFYLTLEINGN